MAVFFMLYFIHVRSGVRSSKYQLIQHFNKNNNPETLKNMTDIFHHIKAIFIPNLLTEDPDDFHAKVISELPDINCFLFGRGEIFRKEPDGTGAEITGTDVKTGSVNVCLIPDRNLRVRVRRETFSFVEFNHNNHKITYQTM
jgi:hypothetical protein